jgi:hypothetical protein
MWQQTKLHKLFGAKNFSYSDCSVQLKMLDTDKDIPNNKQINWYLLNSNYLHNTPEFNSDAKWKNLWSY